MPELPSNSNKSKTPKPKEKFQPVVGKSGKVKKKSQVSKLLSSFITTDAPTLRSFIKNDVLIPLIKKGISDTVNLILWNNPNHRSGFGGGNISRVQYGGFVNGTYTSNQTNKPKRQEINTFDYDGVVFDSKGDAERVLDAMQHAIDEFGIVSVGEFYDLSNVTTTNYMTDKYGWTDISDSIVIRGFDGYYISLPKARPI